MKFPATAFKNEVRLNPDFSTFITFGRFIEGKKIPRFDLIKWFLKAVDKSEYDSADEDKLIKHFCRRTMA